MGTIESMLDELRQIGIEPKRDMTEEERARFAESISEISPDDSNAYLALLNIMGKRHSHDVLELDLECVDSGDIYVEVARDLMILADDTLPLENLQGEVDFDAPTTTLEFTLHGQHHEWTLEVNDDWLDGTLFKRFNELLAAQGSPNRIYHHFNIQTGIVVFGDQEKMSTLERLTGVQFYQE